MRCLLIGLAAAALAGCFPLRSRSVIVVATMLIAAGVAYAHSGGLDQRGGHYNRSTGVYHCHQCRAKTSTRLPTGQAAQQPASTGASFSPDGSTILYAANHDGDLEIYVVNADGTDVRQLTDNDDQDFFPSWSPDGAAIVFSSDRNGAVELFLMDAAGGNQRPLIASER